ncbi:MAG TPA: hypothetical protein VH187_23265 [Scandinavium sp.]|uniref:hypothetical protein n=1 Tax=Scandinavium sp. TaxID=2830653 RepID=UPI002E331452|nr:hypothetical protein [Scandinavium sp.]HEX4504049.1 hypothetical protein [Scandinavium sp.]
MAAPPVGGFVGQGYEFRFQTDLAGPFVSTCQWSAQVNALPQLTIVAFQQSALNVQHVWAGTWGTRLGGDVPFASTYGAAFGSDLSLLVQFFDSATSTVIDGPTQFTTFTWDPSGNLWNVIGSAAASGTFNESDRAELNGIYQNTAVQTYQLVTTHVGLVDNGFVATNPITRLLRVTVVTFPPSALTDPGTPEYFFDLGFLTLNDTQGFVRSARLVFEHQSYKVPASSPGFGYTLRGGTVINVEELTPAT